MTSSTVWLGLFGIMVMSILMARKIPGAMIIGIFVVSGMSWFRGTDFSYFQDSVSPFGEERYKYFKKVVSVEPITSIGAAMDWDLLNKSDLWIAVLTFLYVDILDTSGTMFAMARFSGLTKANADDEEANKAGVVEGSDGDTSVAEDKSSEEGEGDFEGMDRGFLVDSVATIFGALLGTSTVTTYIESAAGIKEGGRTGITAIVTGICFFFSMFFAPILASLPPWAVGGSLVITGSLMMRGLAQIDWNDVRSSVPAFITIVLMPFTYSIAYGILGGLASYIIINGADFLLTKVFGPVKDDDAADVISLKDAAAGEILPKPKVTAV
jgi:AGZA family xanthine/uracil permease-like MFS transporter